MTTPAPSLLGNIVSRTVLYYIALFGAAYGLSRIPGADLLLQGSMDALVSGPGFVPGVSSGAPAPPASITPVAFALSVAATMIGAALLALPVCWIYTLTRQKRGYQQSVVHTLMILPPLVAGVVVLVKYSIALAFSLAGIVAAVRFRNSLEDSKDAVYIFLATALGLAAAVQLPVAAVISVLFNLLILLLYLTDFGKSAAFEGARAQRRLEATRQRMRQTGSFVAMLDSEIFEHMTPEQLEVAADRAWRKRRRMEVTEPDENEMQRRDVLLRIHTRDPDAARAAVEGIFEEFLKKWRFVAVAHEQDGSHYLEYAVQLKKTTRSEDLEYALNDKVPVLATEFR